MPFFSKSNNPQRVKYSSSLSKWQLQDQTFTAQDVNWLRDLIRSSTLPSNLKQEFGTLCDKVDISSANAYVRDTARKLPKQSECQSIARTQAFKTLLQDIQSSSPSQAFRRRPGKQMSQWVLDESSKIRSRYERGSSRDRAVIQAVAAGCRNPLQLEDPPVARRLITQLFVQTLRSPETDESPGIWLVGTYTQLWLRSQELWRFVWQAQSRHPATDAPSIMIPDRSSQPPEAHRPDVPEFGHRHKRPPEGSDAPSKPEHQGIEAGRDDLSAFQATQINDQSSLAAFQAMQLTQMMDQFSAAAATFFANPVFFSPSNTY